MSVIILATLADAVFFVFGALGLAREQTINGCADIVHRAGVFIAAVEHIDIMEFGIACEDILFLATIGPFCRITPFIGIFDIAVAARAIFCASIRAFELVFGAKQPLVAFFEAFVKDRDCILITRAAGRKVFDFTRARLEIFCGKASLLGIAFEIALRDRSVAF